MQGTEVGVAESASRVFIVRRIRRIRCGVFATRMGVVSAAVVQVGRAEREGV